MDKKITLILSYVIFSICLLAIMHEYSRDIDSYKVLYDQSNLYNFSFIQEKFYYEDAFLFLFFIFSKLFGFLKFLNFYDLFFILGSILIFLKLKIFSQYHYFKIAIFLYLALQLISMHEGSQLRSAIITFFLLYAISTENNKILKVLILSVISVFFHKIGIILLVTISFRFFLFFSISLIVFFFLKDTFILAVLNFYDFTEYLSAKAYADYYKLENVVQNPSSITNSIFWAQLIISVIGFFNYRNLSNIQKSALYVVTFSVITYLIFLYTPNISSRIIELSLAGLVPLFCSSKIKLNIFWYTKSIFLFYILFYQSTLYTILFYSNYSK